MLFPGTVRAMTIDRVRPSVPAEDLAQAMALAVDALRVAPPDAWSAPAGSLRWSRWETVEHLSDDHFAYAAQLAVRPSPVDREVPFSSERRRPDGPANTIYADRATDPDGLLQVLSACGALLVAVVRTTEPTVRAHHVFGAADAEGFAAMGVVETLVHTYDVLSGLDRPWDPPADLCARTLARLFPDAPTTTAAWPTLLWATGRIALPDHPRLAGWRWYGAPRA